VNRIHAAVSGSPPVVSLSREGVSDAIWYEVSLIFNGLKEQYDGSYVVEPRDLVENRQRLRGVCVEFNVEFSADDQATNLLARAVSDSRGFAAALRDPTEGVEFRIDDILAGGPFQLARPLRSFQLNDLKRLAELEHGANFSVPGAGKTATTLALHALARARGIADRLIVIAPLSAFGSWEEDSIAVLDPPPTVARYSGGRLPTADIVLINYQRLASSQPVLASAMMTSRTHLVFDEAHRVKRGTAGEWGRAAMALAPLASRRDILSGTPAPNHPSDLVSLMDVLWPSRRVSARIPSDALIRDPTHSAMARVSEVVSPFFVRTTKTMLDLPPIDFEPVSVDLPPVQRQIYDAMRSQYSGLFDLRRFDRNRLAQMGEVAIHLLQAASSPKLLRGITDPARSYRYPPLGIDPRSHLGELINNYPDFEMPGKIRVACQIVARNSAVDEKTLVWSNFPENLLDLEMQLAALEPAVIWGGVPTAENARPGERTRESELARFRNDDNCRVLLANPAALAEGVSLHHWCHNAVYVDRTFNAGQYLQSIDRIHRLGLKKKQSTTISIVTAAETVDDAVSIRLAAKTEWLGLMLADPLLTALALPDEDDTTVFEEDLADLEEVFHHLAGR
jgi:SNF2 family DNA or RNA helicase